MRDSVEEAGSQPCSSFSSGGEKVAMALMAHGGEPTAAEAAETAASGCDECSRAELRTDLDLLAHVTLGMGPKPAHEHCHTCGSVCRMDVRGSCAACDLPTKGITNRLCEVVGYDLACAGCKLAHDRTLADILDKVSNKIEDLDVPHVHCHHCGEVGALQSYCDVCACKLYVPGAAWALIHDGKVALASAAFAMGQLRRTCLFIPVWRHGALHTVVCTYQGELSLPAIETSKEERRARTAMLEWANEMFVPSSAKQLRHLIQHAQHIGPIKDAGSPCYLSLIHI